MPRSKLIKAILLNIFILPGAGHYILKQKIRGSIIMAVVICLLVALTFHLTFLIQQQLGSVVPASQDFNELYRISTKLSQGLLTENIGVIKTYLYLLISCYIVGIADLIWLYFSSKTSD